jgi:osmoprotectant transport system substrate-binding protein
MTMTRSQALGVLGAALLTGCGSTPRSTVAVGSKNFTESTLIGELYAQLLEARGLTVERKLNLGGTQIAMAALERGDIDLYPEYTGTALLVALKEPPLPNAAAIYATVKREYAARFHLAWLAPSPMNDTQAIATTPAVAQRFRLRTLSDLAHAASQMRLGAIPEFVNRADALPGLQHAYGGFIFKEIRMFDAGLKYKALLSGDVDVVVAFGTDGQLDADHLLLLEDNKHFWPEYHVAPVVREETLARHPEIRRNLDALAPHLTNGVMRRLNEKIDGEKQDPADVARAFLAATGLVHASG